MRNQNNIILHIRIQTNSIVRDIFTATVTVQFAINTQCMHIHVHVSSYIPFFLLPFMSTTTTTTTITPPDDITATPPTTPPAMAPAFVDSEWKNSTSPQLKFQHPISVPQSYCSILMCNW